MSHGDEAVRLPDGFQSVATSEQVLLWMAWPWIRHSPRHEQGSDKGLASFAHVADTTAN